MSKLPDDGDPLAPNNLLTPEQKKNTSWTPVLDSDQELFGRLLFVSKDRNIDLQKLFKFELSNVPLALANNDGSLSKTNKAQTMKDLEAYAPAIHTTDSFIDDPERDLKHTAVFIDYMAVVQTLSSKGGIRTFGQLVFEVIKIIKRGFLEGNCVHVVSDRYDYAESIKSGERKHRGATSDSPEIKSKARDQVFPCSLKTFLSNPKNKDNFDNFAFQEMADTFQEELTVDQHLILSGGFEDHKRVVQVSCGGTQDIEEFFSTQDEADTRIWLHVNDAAVRYNTKTVIIWSPDTDVFVLGIHFFRDTDIENIWFKTGTRDNMRYIPIHMVQSNLIITRLVITQFPI